MTISQENTQQERILKTEIESSTHKPLCSNRSGCRVSASNTFSMSLGYLLAKAKGTLSRQMRITIGWWVSGAYGPVTIRSAVQDFSMLRPLNLFLILLVAHVFVGASGTAWALEEADCTVPDSDALLLELEQLERKILLTQYVEAVEGLRELQADLVCMQGAAESSDLGRLLADLGIALNRLGLVSDSDEAFRQAAAIEPTLQWNDTFAATLGLKFYNASSEVRSSVPVRVQLTGIPEDAELYVDGKQQNLVMASIAVYKGRHLLQLERADGWTAKWVDLYSPISVDLTKLEAPEEAEADFMFGYPKPAGAPLVLQRIGYASAAVGAGLFGGSLLTARRMYSNYSEIDTLPETVEEFELMNAQYNTTVLPFLQATNGLRIAAGAAVAVGGAAWVTGTVLGRRQFSGLTVSPVHVAISGSF